MTKLNTPSHNYNGKSLMAGFLSICLLFFSSVGQTALAKSGTPSSSSAVFSYGKFKVGSTVYVFSDKVNLRESPDLNSKVARQLKLGQALTIKTRSEETHEVNGYKDYWYEVSGNEKGQPFTGFLWGGLIAKAAIKVNSDDDSQNELVLLGLSGKGAGSHLKQAEARLVDEGILISKTSFSPIETAKSSSFNYTVKGSLLKNKGFVPFIDLVKFRFEYDSSRYDNGEVLLVLKGTKLSQAFSVNCKNGSSLKYIFPSDPQGEENRLKVFLESEGQETLKATYDWSGKSLKKLEASSKPE